MKYFIGLLSVLFLLPGLNSALAGDSGNIGLGVSQIDGEPTRSWFVYGDVKPGQVIHDKALVENTMKEPVTIVIYPVDVHVAEDGAYTPDGDESIPVDVGSWVKLDKGEVSLAPGERRLVDFTINVPKQVAIGDHTGGILIRRKVPTKELQKDPVTGEMVETGVQIVTRVGVRIYVTITGEPVRRLSFDKLSFEKNTDGKPFFYFSLNDEGNTKLNPMASVEIFDTKDNKLVQTFSASMKELFPGSRVKIPVEWKEPLNGSFIAKAKIADPNDATKFLTQETKFDWKIAGINGAEVIAGVPISNLAIIVVVIIILLLSIIIKLVSKKRRR